jgi:N6-adenosine-specific RNA methylase IME4
MTVRIEAGDMRTLPNAGRYRCILADVPSRFVAGTKGRPQHYDRMRDDELAKLPIGDLAHPDGCWLFYWSTSPHGRTFWQVPEAWGFKFSGRAFVWIKTLEGNGSLPRLHTGMGYTTRKNAEDCWLFRRGMPKRKARDVHEVIIAPVREHSRKPDEQYERIQRYCPGPRLELFARHTRPGWSAFGNETTKFDKKEAA